MALGLDRNDTIIRRRLAQKLNFLTEDLADAAEPDESGTARLLRQPAAICSGSRAIRLRTSLFQQRPTQ